MHTAFAPLLFNVHANAGKCPEARREAVSSLTGPSFLVQVEKDKSELGGLSLLLVVGFYTILQ